MNNGSDITLLGAFSGTALWMVENRRATRIKVLVHDGFGVRLAAHRLTQGKFHWPSSRHGAQMEVPPRAASGAGNQAFLAATWIFRINPYDFEDMPDRYRDEGQSKSEP